MMHYSIDLHFDNQTDTSFPLDKSSMQDICQRSLAQVHFPIQRIECDIQVINSDEMTKLNHTTRGKAKPTNVLSFQYPQTHQHPTAFLGDIVFCAQVVFNEAETQKKSPAQHATHLLVHALLHLLGYNHEQPEEANEMECLEIQILSQLQYPNPYEDPEA